MVNDELLIGSGNQKAIDVNKLIIKPYSRNEDTEKFRSGDEDIDAFINTAEVERYNKEMYGKTYCVYFQGRLVAYFTLAASSIHQEDVVDNPEKRAIKVLPAILIGRLGVQQEWQGRGIAKELVEMIVGFAGELNSKLAIRLVILNVRKNNEKAINFYRKFGFDFCNPTRKQRQSGYYTMFIDLRKIWPHENSDTDENKVKSKHTVQRLKISAK